MNGDPWAWTETFSRTDRPRCVCGPDSTGEAPDERPDCPVHGLDAAEGDTGWDGPAPY